jgi:hypothetical protein
VSDFLAIEKIMYIYGYNFILIQETLDIYGCSDNSLQSNVFVAMTFFLSIANRTIVSNASILEKD